MFPQKLAIGRAASWHDGEEKTNAFGFANVNPRKTRVSGGNYVKSRSVGEGGVDSK